MTVEDLVGTHLLLTVGRRYGASKIYISKPRVAVPAIDNHLQNRKRGVTSPLSGLLDPARFATFLDSIEPDQAS